MPVVKLKEFRILFSRKDVGKFYQNIQRHIPENTVTCISDYRRVLDWIVGFIATYTFTHSEL
jgi:hypothetical protein